MISPEQISRMAQELLASLELDEEKLPIVERYVRRVVNRILIHCNRQDIPEGLELLAVEITEEMLRADKVKPPPQDQTPEVSSVKRGDTTITYQDKDSAYQQAESFLGDYHGALTHYRKMRLPRDQRYE